MKYRKGRVMIWDIEGIILDRNTGFLFNFNFLFFGF